MLQLEGPSGRGERGGSGWHEVEHLFGSVVWGGGAPVAPYGGGDPGDQVRVAGARARAGAGLLAARK